MLSPVCIPILYNTNGLVLQADSAHSLWVPTIVLEWYPNVTVGPKLRLNRWDHERPACRVFDESALPGYVGSALCGTLSVHLNLLRVVHSIGEVTGRFQREKKLELKGAAHQPLFQICRVWNGAGPSHRCIQGQGWVGHPESGPLGLTWSSDQ